MRPAVFVIAVLFLPSAVAAQDSPIKAGDRVRFWRQQTLGVTEGTIAGWEADSFAITDNWIPITSVTRLEVRRQKISRGALVALDAGGTAVGGALLGAGLGYLTFGETGAAYGAALVGVTGLVFGAVYGSFASVDRWEEVPLGRLRVSFAPQSDGRFALGLSVRFKRIAKP